MPVADAGGAADGEGGARAGLGGDARDAGLPGVAKDGAVPALRVHVVEEDELGAAFDDGDGEAVAILVPGESADAARWAIGSGTWRRKQDSSRFDPWRSSEIPSLRRVCRRFAFVKLTFLRW